MRYLHKQKFINYILALPLLLIGFALPLVASSPVSAATNPSCIANSKCAKQPAGTCFANIQGEGYRINKCKTFGIKNGSKASDGKTKIDLSKYCYSFSSSESSNNISRVNCDDTSLPASTPASPPASNSDGAITGCTTGGVNDTKCSVYSQPTTDPALASGSSVECTKTNCNLVDKYIDPLIQLLSALVGIAVTISIIIGGIQYSTSAGDPAKVSAAKNRIRNSIIALVAFLFLYAFLQFLVPGGIFNR